MQKKNLIMLLVLLLCMTTINVSAYDIEVPNADGVTIYYNYINEGTELEVTNSGSYHYSGTVVIPDEVNVDSNILKVTSIGTKAFYCGEKLTVTIGNNVKTIGDYAFNKSNLTSIVIPNNVTTIGNYAFDSCINLSLITIGNSVTTIGDYAFSYCQKLSSLTIPDNVISIGWFAFQNCSELTSVIIGNGVTTIGDYAFYNCQKLGYVSIGSNVTNIGNNAFNSCDGISKVKIYSNAIVSQDYSNSIAYDYFGRNIEEFIIGEGVTSIGDNAFIGCQKLEISSTVEKIGKKILTYRGKVDVTCMATTPPETDDNTFSKTNLNYSTLYVPASCLEKYQTTAPWSEFKKIIAITEPEVINNVEIDGIYYNLYIKTQTAEVISNPASYIGDIVIPSLVTKDGVDYSVTSIGNQAFEYCIKLTSVVIPNSVTSIGNGAFYQCSLTSIIIPNSVTSIGDEAFTGSALRKVELNSNAIVSKDYAQFCSLSFYFGKYVEEFILGEEVTSIGKWAFADFSHLTSINIHDKITRIGTYAFSNCTSLTSFIIPASVTSIGINPFLGCNNLLSLQVEKENTIYDSRDNCNAIIETASNTLIVGCNYSVIPDGVKIVGNSAFTSCINLTSVNIPNSVTTIGDYTFMGCKALTSIAIPNSVTTIGNSSFLECDNITDFYCYAEQVPETGWNIFGYLINTATLHVPAISIDAYKNAEQWKDFVNIVALTDPSGIEATTATQQPTIVECYTIDGKRIVTPHRGLNIIKMSDGTTRKVVVK